MCSLPCKVSNFVEAWCNDSCPDLVPTIVGNLKKAFCKTGKTTVSVASICTGWGVGDMVVDSINDILGGEVKARKFSVTVLKRSNLHQIFFNIQALKTARSWSYDKKIWRTMVICDYIHGLMCQPIFLLLQIWTKIGFIWQVLV